MSRPIRLVLLAAAAALLPTAALAGQASTTRIETRPFYGATVTLEEGVRVFRPLPYHSKVIINPGGKTPLTLGFEENKTVTSSTNPNGERGNGRERDDGGRGASERGNGGGNGFASGDGGSANPGPAREAFGHRTASRPNRAGNGTAPQAVKVAPQKGDGGGGAKH